MAHKLSPEQLKELKQILKEQTGKYYTDGEAQKAGLDIMCFVYAKELRRRDGKNNK